jgi:hypothetical protein
MNTRDAHLKTPLQNRNQLSLDMEVYHSDIYWGNECMTVVGIRQDQVELEGDYSGGTHNVCQRDWLPLNGVLLFAQNKN